MSALTTSLAGVFVVELGDRIGAGACGSLLAHLGATVLFIEPKTVSGDGRTKWHQRALWAANKRSLIIDADKAEDRILLAELVARCDVVLTSDLDCEAPARGLGAIPDHVIHCDVSAFGTVSEAGPPLSEAEVQAWAGLVDTTGSPSGAPVLTHLPVVELSAAVYAAAAAVAALRARRLQKISQRAQVAMFDCAVTMLATFLPKHFAGDICERIGNRHPSISPWNCYRSADGWIQICTGTEDQWRRLAKLLIDDGMTVDPVMNSRPERMHHLDEVDELIESWTRKQPIAAVISRLSEVGVPCGPVQTIAEFMRDANLGYRGAIREALDPMTGGHIHIPGNPFSPGDGAGSAIPARDEARAEAANWRRAPPRGGGQNQPVKLGPVLDGIRVLEIGQWTTAPLASRLLASLGADVVKVETAEGDPARASPPLVDGKSYLFNLNNSGKRCVVIDMRSAAGKAELARLVCRCDVVIENLKPGSLARLGFSFAELAKLNARVVYCAISGFGAASLYEGRAAMDTVLQAMCGVMDLTRQGGIPYKTGVSIADLLGGYFGLLGTLAALEVRDRNNVPQFVDLSMQDLTAWLTQLSWNTADDGGRSDCIVRCADGFLLVPSRRANDETSLEGITVEGMNKNEATRYLRSQGVSATPVRTVREVATDPAMLSHGIIIDSTEQDGRVWPLLGTPFRLEKTPARVRHAPIDINSTAEVLDDWQMTGPH
jgi:crotonobetainyl-CoA:carnitine CoA-transferase CaiB-like acyl-CoA transferase